MLTVLYIEDNLSNLSGARNFLTKPLEVAELLALLDEVADERQQRSSPASAGSPS
jgi:DNA-binding response OmpR family regulator